jgi:putative PEP-CTERM system TPR-repeat lipoprotein
MDVSSSAGKRRSRSRRRKNIARNVAIATLLVAVVGAGSFIAYRQQGSDPQALLARASSAYKKTDFAAATIDLRTVLAIDRNNAEARELLGLSYLKLGDAKGALRELEKARSLGAESNEIDLATVRSQILLGKFDEARSQLAAHSDNETADWTAARGTLELARRNFEPARGLFNKVLEGQPEHDEARRGLLQAALATGDIAAARREIEPLLKLAQKDAALWVVKGALQLQEKQRKEARESFDHALALAPKNRAAVLGLAQVLLEDGDSGGAKAKLDSLGSQGADDPRVNFLRAQIAEQRKDFETALLDLNKVLLVLPNDREALVMAARLNFSLGQFARAEDFASQLLQLEPENEAARRLLGSIQLAGGNLQNVGDNAELPAVDSQDPGTLALLGTAYLKHGDYASAEANLKKAAELAPGSLPIRTQLALGKISTGNVEAAIADLKAVLAEQKDFVQARVMLTLAYLSQKRSEDALGTARELIEIKPDDALGYNLLGYVFEVGADKTQAHSAYEQALAKDPDFHPARVNLARLAVQAKDKGAARQYLQGVLARDEFNATALQGLAALAMDDDNADEAEKLWQQAREHNPEAVAPRVALARYYRTKGNLTRAEDAIREAYKLASYAAPVQAEYANVMLGIGDNQAAVKAAQALVTRAPESLPVLELLARAFNQLGDQTGLSDTLRRIVKLQPDHQPAQILLAQLALRHKDKDGAEAIARTMIARPENAAAGYELSGDIAFANGQQEAAVEAYAQAFKMAPDSNRVLKLERAERSLGIDKKRLEKWIAERPDDARARLAQASILQEAGASEEATAAYERMLATGKQDPVVLNNLAWLYFERKDKRALDTARQAYDLAPQQAAIVDTYAWILFQQGQREQGLEILKKAAELAPGNADIAFHVTSALAESGQRAQALTQLRALLDEHKQFSLRKDAEALLALLEKG